MHMFLTHHSLPISQIGQAALPQAFRPCGTKNMETVETDLEKLIKRSYNDSSLSFNVTVILTHSWTGLQINQILEQRKLQSSFGRLVQDIFRDIFVS